MKTKGEQAAYPHDASKCRDTGLTKRELFAAMAMQGLLAKHGDDDYPTDSLARYSVAHADCLLAELAKDGAA
ncbi:hypothetical protein ABE488_00900 [Luteimonas sp. TWI662]|uniref:hypothetical protein n=1 Tax=Luteimonas sp. TWI662 TaxID=3136789 RepID=UPI003209F240